MARRMRVLLYGATGMVGRGVLLACLDAPDVEAVCAVGRRPLPVAHPKLVEIVEPDPTAIDRGRLAPFDACFFCVGVSSIGMSEADYTRATYDLTTTIAAPLAAANPSMTFVYVSGAGTDPSERGPSMWARVKGRTENALLQMPFKAVFLFRPGVMQPAPGTRSRVVAYRVLYALAGPFVRIMKALRPDLILTTRGLGIAMLEVVRHGAASPVVGPAALKSLVRASGASDA